MKQLVVNNENIPTKRSSVICSHYTLTPWLVLKQFQRKYGLFKNEITKTATYNIGKGSNNQITVPYIAIPVRHQITKLKPVPLSTILQNSQMLN
jgi:hypothetical protein